jgi:hypothetical protein
LIATAARPTAQAGEIAALFAADPRRATSSAFLAIALQLRRTASSLLLRLLAKASNFHSNTL